MPVTRKEAQNRVAAAEAVDRLDKTLEVRRERLSEGPRWARLIAWVAERYCGRMVAIEGDGRTVAYIVAPEFAAMIGVLSAAWLDREAPFTREALDKWRADVVGNVSLTELFDESESQQSVKGLER